MDEQKIQKLTYGINAVILAMVFGLMAFFKMCGVKFLVWFSIPAALVYIIGFLLIAKLKLLAYVRMVFTWLPFYMCVTTVCLGYGYGFHLYCFSLVPISFVTEYMGYKMRKKSINGMVFSLGIGLLYLASTSYVSYFGPVYVRDQKYAAVFWLFNSASVLFFLTFYTNYLIRTIIRSEDKLKEIALVDRLTGLYNRHFMLECLDKLDSGCRTAYIAIADIDDFKKINDNYGHNAGDLVLEKVSARMKSDCKSCTVSRWGGEEFLILIPPTIADPTMLIDELRKHIADERVNFEGQEIAVTITAGVAKRQEGQSIDQWIQTADGKLYDGKHSGKNKVVK